MLFQSGSYHKITGVLACSQHGNRVAPLGFPAPPTEIYQAERMAYSAFSRRYEALYRQFIDPILVGLTLESRVARIETAILPVARLILQSFSEGVDPPSPGSFLWVETSILEGRTRRFAL